MEEDFDFLNSKLQWEAILENKYSNDEIETGNLKLERIDFLLFLFKMTQNCQTERVLIVNVFVILIEDKQKLSAAIEKLTQLFPPEASLLHLKRVKPPVAKDDGFQIVISHVDQTTKQDIESKLNEIEYVQVQVQQVPKSKPLTRPQFEFAKKLWPVNFFENKYVSDCLNKRLFKPSDLNLIVRHLQTLLRLFRKHELDVTLIADKDEMIAYGTPQHNAPLPTHSVSSAISKVAEQQLIDSRQLKQLNEKLQILPYLCTSYDAFMTSEPCVMCSMALIHSRIKRLFFLEANHTRQLIGRIDIQTDCMPDLALQSLKVHKCKSLNHHFEVFRISFQLD